MQAGVDVDVERDLVVVILWLAYFGAFVGGVRLLLILWRRVRQRDEVLEEIIVGTREILRDLAKEDPEREHDKPYRPWAGS